MCENLLDVIKRRSESYETRKKALEKILKLHNIDSISEKKLNKELENILKEELKKVNKQDRQCEFYLVVLQNVTDIDTLEYIRKEYEGEDISDCAYKRMLLMTELRVS